jgi:hypothetical protein
VTTPPGWYPDPSNPSQNRWWDGTNWGSVQETPAASALPQAPAYGGQPSYGQPQFGAPLPSYPPAGANVGAPGYGTPGYGAPAYGAPGYGAPGYGTPGYGTPGYGVAGQPVSETLSWVIAFTPLIGALFALFALGASGGGVFGLIFVGWLLTYVTSLVLASVDVRRLRAAGWAQSAPWTWAFLGPWVYLLVRAIRRRRLVPKPGWIQMAVAIATSIVFSICVQVANFSNAGFGTSYDRGAIEQQIVAYYQAHGTTVTATCPASESMIIGSSFECTATDSTGNSQSVLVLVKDGQGDVSLAPV